MISVKTPVPAGTDSAQLVTELQKHYNITLGRFECEQIPSYLLLALSLTVRDRLIERWRETRLQEIQNNPKRVFYLSLEFLLGRTLSNAVMNLQTENEVAEALRYYGTSLEELRQNELDAGLGNGGLGRLAACFLDSCATLGLPVTGYGIRYEYGMFHQRIEQGRQVEYPDHWLREGNPWELERPELTKRVKFYGHTEFYINDRGRKCARWSGTNDVLAVPYDVPIPGYGNGVVNTLRLWRAAATDEFDLEEFNAGDYTEAVAAKNRAEQITMVLYPNDASENGKELRLRQQYFLASASLQDVLADWVHFHGENFGEFANKHVFQLNDTHPTLAVAELMRLLLDDYLLEWDVAWRITTSTMAYTNHTLLPEALEKWPVRLMRELLPRLLDIIYEINARFLAEVALRWPGDTQRQQRMSLIEEGNDPHVRMAYLGIVGSFSVNGVAALHSNLLKRGLFKDFFELWPEKFNNKTNGVTPRRWLAHSNRKLAELITEAVGDGWQTDLEKISHLKDFVNDSAFCERWFQIKQHNKAALAELVHRECGVCFDTGHMFDVQVKRIHEYKRQLLNVLHIIHLYDRIKRGDAVKMKPRCVLIGGKAAPGYAMAKLIIKLINNVAAVINADTSVKHLLQVVFLPNYRVSSMEIICPGTDLSEQISTAGKEASGTGNMKFMMNGAVTIGTYDGANIEILEAAGGENFFLFGLRVEDIPAYRAAHKPNQIIEHDEDLKRVMQLLECGHFSLFEPGIFDPIVAAIRRDDDPWMVAADFRSYVEAQRKAAEMYQDRAAWTRMSILNAAASGRFSSDRTIREYARDIWQII
ncbi:glycogen/starch/alpha-glucan phosphorylase [Saccharophagus sp. K07]|uniref:glycogen/starch/alpha-glucan phosphorylase n=1 Tax=Saccharophagus sp. K07 TaxID=2283636 RepID=UPI0021039BA1|nr:glycogen/starch/alpha-glucan phosphorylase [Saccharophagus sp. K07]